MIGVSVIAFLVLSSNLVYVISNVSTKFVSPKCHYDSDCGKDAYCKNNKDCSCKDGYLPYDHNITMCLKEAVSIGDPCLDNVQCTAAFGTRAECYKIKQETNSTGHCRCTANSHFHENICYSSVLVGGRCHVNGECKVKSDIAVYCETGKCACPYSHHPNSDGSDCFPSLMIGDACRNHSDCVTTHSHCFGVCRCKVQYVLSYNGKRCLPIVDSLNDPCEENGQCEEYLQNSVCDPFVKLCQCSSVSVLRDGACWNAAELGDKCSDSRECVIQSNNTSSVKCLNQTCSCTPGYKTNLVRNDCVKGSSMRTTSEHSIFKVLVVSFLVFTLGTMLSLNS